MSRPAPRMPVVSSRPQLRLESELRALRIAGTPVQEWETEPHDVAQASPDLFFRHACGGGGLAVYVDGCQWHGCPVHFRPHASGKDPNHQMTAVGIARQRLTDRTTRAALRAKGVKVLAFWEHDITRDAARVAREIAAALAGAGAGGSPLAEAPLCR